MTEQQLYDEVNRLYDKWGLDPQFVTELFQFVQKQYVQEVDSESFTGQFREIFPSVKLKTGKNFKSNAKDLEKKLKYFAKNYEYTPETILEAARQYVEHAEQAKYEYIRTAAYFVYKLGDGSDLADWCERVLNKEFTESQEPLHKLL